MAWNQPGEEKKRPPPRGVPPENPSLDDLLRRLRRQLQRLWRPGSNRATAALSVVLLLGVLWLITGYYQIAASERGVVQRFGRYVATEQPGHGWHWPWPIETLTKLDVASPEGVDSKALMLTSDQSLIDVSWSLQYRIADPRQYLFQLRDPLDSLRQVGETVMREIVGANALPALLDAAARPRIATTARARIQRMLDGYGAGVVLAGVSLSEVRLPDAVQGAQRDASKAAEDRQHALTDAEGYASDIVPKAQSVAQRQLTDAQVYATQTRATAEGEVQRFTQLAQAYAHAPEVTRSRMYIETMESILSRAHKIILDTRSGTGNVIYVPLDKLAEAIRGAGSGQPAASAATAVPSAAATPAAGTGNESSEDARNRERPER